MTGNNRLFRLLDSGADKLSAPMLDGILEACAELADLNLNNDILKQLVNDYAQLEQKNYKLLREISEKQQTIEEDLAAAGRIQKGLFPQKLPELEHYCFNWECLPCDKMGGDLINIIPYDEENWIFYIIDVSGHGPRAAMITVALSQFLNPFNRGRSQFDHLSPAETLRELEAEFPFERFESFFTIVYGTLHLPSGNVRMCNAAHPFPLLIDGKSAVFVEENNPVIGLKLTDDWQETQITLSEKNRLYLYTDGLTEARNNLNEQFGEKRLLKAAESLKNLNCNEFVTAIKSSLTDFSEGRIFDDDFSWLLLGKR
ncbi:MAG: hypothetical protein CVV41_22715 [Candidatus Riflebacteria bacterium HGW-Riflebacteria-1]|jgi:sigma-B regulation protein RsbU (phosphoserine phosphatase)|nr:MAG: hypothetical protein CVV41_22715 [Candidatus Riflebacteria bacterium HGW-Riflebacteria-1]